MYVGNSRRSAKSEPLVRGAVGDEVGQVARVVCILQKNFHDVLEGMGCPEVLETKNRYEQIGVSERIFS